MRLSLVAAQPKNWSLKNRSRLENLPGNAEKMRNTLLTKHLDAPAIPKQTGASTINYVPNPHSQPCILAEATRLHPQDPPKNKLARQQ